MTKIKTSNYRKVIKMNDEILNTAEAAKLLHADKRTLERNAKSGKYPQGVCGRHGRYWLFNKQKLLQYIFKTD